MKLDEGRAGKPSSAAAVAARWFAQDMFDDPNLAAEEATPAAAAPGAASWSQFFMPSFSCVSLAFVALHGRFGRVIGGCLALMLAAWSFGQPQVE